MAKKRGAWQLFTKRTNDPKLAWIEVQLDALGIPNRRNGESFHAPILEVPSDRMAEAEALLQKRVNLRDMGTFRKNMSVDDIRDDHPRWTKDPLVRARLSHG